MTLLYLGYRVEKCELQRVNRQTEKRIHIQKSKDRGSPFRAFGVPRFSPSSRNGPIASYAKTVVYVGCARQTHTNLISKTVGATFKVLSWFFLHPSQVAVQYCWFYNKISVGKLREKVVSVEWVLLRGHGLSDTIMITHITQHSTSKVKLSV